MTTAPVLSIVADEAVTPAKPSKKAGGPKKRNRTPGPKIYARKGGGFTIRWRYRDAAGRLQEIKKVAKGTTRTAALQEARAIERDVLDRMHADPAERPPAPTVAEFLPKFLAYCRTNAKSPATVKLYEQHIRLHVIPTIGHRRLDTLNPPDFEAVKIACVHLGVNTRRQVIASLNRMLAVAMILDDARGLPRAEQLKREDKPVVAYRPDEVAAVIAACESDRDRAFVYLGMHGGLRRGEVIAVRGEDFSPTEDGRLSLQIRRSVWGKVLKLPKSGKSRVIPLTRPASDALRAHIATLADPRGYLFPATEPRKTASGELLPAGDTAYVRVMERVCKSAGVKCLATHGNRKTAATAMAKAGASAWQIADHLGHSGTQLAARYVDREAAASSRAATLIESYK